jgi:hypothetical protein
MMCDQAVSWKNMMEAIKKNMYITAEKRISNPIIKKIPSKISITRAPITKKVGSNGKSLTRLDSVRVFRAVTPLK